MTRTLDNFKAAITPTTRRHVHPGALANRHVRHFVDRAVKVCVPDRIYWCNGSDYERQRLIDDAIREGMLIPVDRKEQAACYLHRSDSGADAERAMVCAPAACANFEKHFKDCMRGRTMYIVPFAAGPIGAEPAKVGVQITDSIVDAINTGLFSHVGDAALRFLGDGQTFVRRVRSFGAARNASVACG